MPKGNKPDKGGPGDGGGDGGGNDVLYLPDLTAKKNFKLWFDHPITPETDVPYFNYTNTHTALNVLGGVHRDGVESEVIYLSETHDTANMAGGDDYVVGNLGNDTLNGDGGNDYIWGDTNGGLRFYDLSGVDLDGNDVIDGGDGNDEIFGDTNSLWDGATGGNDIINGGSGDDLIFGDAGELYSAHGGDDTITGGAGDDWMLGDGFLDDASTGGADVFVFADDSGNDVIWDFGEEDILNVAGWTGATGTGDLTIDNAATFDPGDGPVNGTLVSCGEDSIFLVDYFTLHASNFDFNALA